ncbi:MAG: LuxR C-terminal-related transcriptional regulator [Polyangia bacterium]
MHTIELADSAVQALTHAQLPAELVQRTVRTGLVHRSGRGTSPAGLRSGFDRIAQRGTPECLTINGLDPEGKGVMIAFWTARGSRLARDEEATYRRMAHHLGAANRCRRRLRLSGSTVTSGAEAILDDRLRIVHAEGEARDKEAQAELVAVANARSQAKTASLNALKMWPALTEARWTLVDSFERDGKRYVVARENQAQVLGLAQLTGRERQVVVYFALGQSTKEIAYGLGIADSTVRVLLRRAALKLGAPSRRALQAHPDVCRLRSGGSA